VDTPLLYLSFLLPPSEQVLLVPAIKVFLAFLAILEVVAIIAPYYSVLGLVTPVSIAPLFFPLFPPMFI